MSSLSGNLYFSEFVESRNTFFFVCVTDRCCGIVCNYFAEFT